MVINIQTIAILKPSGKFFPTMLTQSSEFSVVLSELWTQKNVSGNLEFLIRCKNSRWCLKRCNWSLNSETDRFWLMLKYSTTIVMLFGEISINCWNLKYRKETYSFLYQNRTRLIATVAQANRCNQLQIIWPLDRWQITHHFNHPTTSILWKDLPFDIRSHAKLRFFSDRHYEISIYFLNTIGSGGSHSCFIELWSCNNASLSWNCGLSRLRRKKETFIYAQLVRRIN